MATCILNIKQINIDKIVSGGQTGADRAAFDFALEKGLEIGGFVPKGRLAEDGKIADKYPNLIETSTSNYSERTEQNVINADATIILSHGDLQGGSLLTKQFAQNHHKSFLFIDFAEFDINAAPEMAIDFIKLTNCKTLNIAGSRASEDTAIYQKTKVFLTLLFD